MNHFDICTHIQNVWPLSKLFSLVCFCVFVGVVDGHSKGNMRRIIICTVLIFILYYVSHVAREDK